MATRIYKVTDILSLGLESSLVRAASQAQAVRAVVDNRYRVAVASQEDIVEGLSGDTKIIDAGSEPVDE
jgi:hypothetical protein